MGTPPPTCQARTTRMLGDDAVRCEWRAEYGARKDEWAEGKGKTIEQLFGLHVKFNKKARYVVGHEGDERYRLPSGVSFQATYGHYHVFRGGERLACKDFFLSTFLKYKYEEERKEKEAHRTTDEKARELNKRRGNLAMELAFGEKLCEALRERGWEGRALHGQTAADLVVRRCGDADDQWRKVQLKTASKGKERAPKWSFHMGRGYPGMLVICHTSEGPKEARPRSWFYDHAAFKEIIDRTGKVGTINVSVTKEGNKWDDQMPVARCDEKREDATGGYACTRTAKALIRLLSDPGPEFERTSIEAAQLDCRSEDDKRERRDMAFLTSAQFPRLGGCTMREGTPHDVVDLYETDRNGGSERRYQVKGVRDDTPRRRWQGKLHGINFEVLKNHPGQKEKGPYAVGEVDVFLFMWYDADREDAGYHVWEIQAHGDMAAHRTRPGHYLAHQTVHFPPEQWREGYGKRPSRVDWTQAYHRFYPYVAPKDKKRKREEAVGGSE